jgi:Kef-type K+ transport system membrane component KefB
MHNETLWFLLGLAVLLGVARLLGEVFRRFGFPAVVGEILAGVVLGKTFLGRLVPGVFGALFPDGPARHMLNGYTTVAVMLLLVVAGIEIDLSVVRRSGRVVLLTSPCGLLLSAALGFGLGMVLPDSVLPDPSRRAVHAAFLGIALSISALPVIAKTLLDLGLMKTDIGLIILSVSVIDDLVGVMAFSILSRHFTVGGAVSVAQVLTSIASTVLFVAVALIVVRPLADRLIAYTAGRDEAATGRTLSVIAVLAFLGAAATEALGMQALFGGFVMGVAVGDSSRLREHTRQVLTDFVSYVFTPAFFATMALRVDFIAAFNLPLVLVVVFVASVSKIAGCTFGARLSGVGWREATAIGFGLCSRGAMEILLALVALDANIIGQPMFVALVVMAIATSLISGPALVRLLWPQRSPLVALLAQGVVVLDPPVATRQELIRLLAHRIAQRMDRPQDGGHFTQRVLDREALASTGVGDGVAFPHAEVPGLPRPVLAFARLASGADFDPPDGVPVRLVFLLLMPPRDYERQLQLLSAMARLMTRPEVRLGLLGARDEGAVLATLDDVGRTPMPRDAPPATISAALPSSRTRKG